MFPAKGWTETLEGYINEAKQLTQCILQNRLLLKRPYAWAVHINHNEELPPELVASIWKRACRTLRKRGVVPLWVREANRLNKVHYHLIVKDPITKKTLKGAIDEAMPPRHLAKWRKRIEDIHSEWHLAHYVTKAVVSGYVRGRKVPDLYYRKRLLFRPSIKFKKYGVIGKFWVENNSKESLWQGVIATEKRISEGLEKPGVERLVKHVRNLLGEDVPVRRIERAFGYWSDSPAVQNWIVELSGF